MFVDSLGLSSNQWMIITFTALLMGMAKTGLSGFSLFAVSLMAVSFGARASTGLLLPLLNMADVMAIVYYHRHTDWHFVWRLMPGSIVGIGLAVLAGNAINDTQFRMVIGVIILCCLVAMVWNEYRGGRTTIKDHWSLASLTGFLCGFSSMIGNAAGPILAIYLLSLRLNKNTYIGVTAWFFALVNIVKFPMHVFFWHTITWKTLSIDAMMIPAIILGAFIGVVAVRLIPEKIYRLFIIVSSAIAAFKLF